MKRAVRPARPARSASRCASRSGRCPACASATMRSAALSRQRGRRTRLDQRSARQLRAPARGSRSGEGSRRARHVATSRAIARPPFGGGGARYAGGRMRAPAVDLYETLGVSPSATTAELRRAYRRLALEHHPDRAGPASASRFAQIAEAYRLLSDPTARTAYDAYIGSSAPLSARRRRTIFARTVAAGASPTTTGPLRGGGRSSICCRG